MAKKSNKEYLFSFIKFNLYWAFENNKLQQYKNVKKCIYLQNVDLKEMSDLINSSLLYRRK